MVESGPEHNVMLAAVPLQSPLPSSIKQNCQIEGNYDFFDEVAIIHVVACCLLYQAIAVRLVSRVGLVCITVLQGLLTSPNNLYKC